MNLTIITWALTALSLMGTLLVTRRRVEGFYLWAATNVGWIIIDLNAGQTAQAAMFAAYLALAFYGIWEWKRK